MKKIKPIVLMFSLLTVFGLLLVGCSATGILSANPNRAPTAVVAQTAFTVYPGIPVSLDGTQSTDPDNQSLSYQWDVIAQPASGSAFTLSGATTPTPTFVTSYYKAGAANYAAPNPTYLSTNGTVLPPYLVRLTVKDKYGDTNSQNVAIVVRNQAPTANYTWSNALPAPGQLRTLDASTSTDPDTDKRNPLHYSWSVVDQPRGTTYILGPSGTTSPFPTLSTPTVDFTPGTGANGSAGGEGVYTVQVTATDEYGLQSSSAHIIATAGNTAPVVSSVLTDIVTLPSTLAGTGDFATPFYDTVETSTIPAGTFSFDAGQHNDHGLTNTENDTLTYSWVIKGLVAPVNLAVSGTTKTVWNNGDTLSTSETFSLTPIDKADLAVTHDHPDFYLELIVDDGQYASAARDIYFEIKS